MSLTELIVHEAGHNTAKDFYHRKTVDELENGETGEYEYNQEGLQSNQGGLIYPTLYDNTLRILQDFENLENITIL